MGYIWWLVLSALAFALGEYTSKMYIESRNSVWLIATFVAYNIGIGAWFPALMKRNELAVVGTLWSLLSLVATVAIGTVVFRERLAVSQTLGVVFAFLAIALLSH